MKTLIESRKLKMKIRRLLLEARIMKIQVTKTLFKRRNEHEDTVEMQK